MDGMDCGCFARRHRESLILVKGPFIFGFVNEKSPSPKFVVALQDMQVKRPVSSGQVHLEPNLDSAEYELTLATDVIAKEFIDVVRE